MVIVLERILLTRQMWPAIYRHPNVFPEVMIWLSISQNHCLLEGNPVRNLTKMVELELANSLYLYWLRYHKPKQPPQHVVGTKNRVGYRRFL